MDTFYEGKGKANYSIVKSRDFVWRSRVDLSYMQNRLICYILSRFEPSIIKYPDGTVVTRPVKTEYHFNIPEYAEICNLSANGELYRSIKRDLKKLRDDSLWVQNDEGDTETVSWLSNVKESHGRLLYEIDSRIIPYIDHQECNKQNHGFLEYDFREILPLEPRKKIIPLFELMYSKSFIGHYSVSSEELLWLLCLNDNTYYNDIKRFNNKILKPCIKSINDSTILTVEYETLGNPIHTFEFTIKKKKLY